ncbi:MAG: hypothetical protein GX941_09340, partial [Candidatus Methanofastidiosa archaeon]|nr:hypothetical protein [Candidatus Methanofastidiosa archaeon]
NICKIFENYIDYLFVEEIDNLYDNSDKKPLYFYRTRYSNKKPTIEEMFHIPFEQRQKIKEQRFSINGIPCLYLGATPYVCIKEIVQTKTDNDKLYTSRFFYKSGSGIKILNLATHFQDIFRVTLNNDDLFSLDSIAYGKISKEDYIKKTIYTYPIQCACSFLIKENNRDYKIEYTIPQIIMSCISSFNVDGVSYCSTKFDVYDLSSIYLMTNFAFPAYIQSKEKYSEKLTRSFEITEPLCFIEIQQDKSQIHTIDIHRFVDTINKPHYEAIINGSKYIDTLYYKLEKALDKEQSYSLTPWIS